MKALLSILFVAWSGTLAQAQLLCTKTPHDAPFDIETMVASGTQLIVAGHQPGDSDFQVAVFESGIWTVQPGRFNGSINALLDTANGLVAVGQFTDVDGAPIHRVARLQGGTWSRLGMGIDNGAVNAVEEYGGELFCGGSFTAASGVPASNLAMWDGSSWAAAGAGTDGPIRALANHNGLLVVGGSFDHAGGLPHENIAAWDSVDFATPGFAQLPPVYDFEIEGTELFAAAEEIYKRRNGAWTQVGQLMVDEGIRARAITFHRGDPIALGEWVTFCLASGDAPCVAGARYSGGIWNLFLYDDGNPTLTNLSAEAIDEVLYVQGASPGLSYEQFTEITPFAVAYSNQPKVANWYEDTTLTLQVNCLDSVAPATISIGGSGPIPVTVTAPNEVTALLLAGTIPGQGIFDVVFEQNGHKSIIPNGIQMRPLLALAQKLIFANYVQFTVDSGSQLGTAWVYVGVTPASQPFPVPGIQGLLEMPLAQITHIVTGSLSNSPLGKIGYNPLTVPKGLPIYFQVLVAEDVGPTTRWAITNTKTVQF